MQHLYEKLRDDTLKWRKSGYPCEDYPLIGEILRWQFEGEAQDRVHLKYLREPQFQSLELYWYLRLKQDTQHIVDLYKHYYGDNVKDFCEVLGLPTDPNFLAGFQDVDRLIDLVKNDEDFVKRNRLDPLHETMTLPYPSYIFALAMGTGKTLLIGTLIATEFAMSLRYQGSDFNFMKNALVFAPGTTIIVSLRDISKIPFDRILPPSLYRDFNANYKITYPQAGAKDIQVGEKSFYNIIVTNTEKISLRATPRKNQRARLLKEKKLQENLRLKTITSLPGLGVFSDEAHHTYGNKMDKELKRVRATVNHIHEHTPLVAVINTTGTPYAKKQMLREVVAWYSLGEGIRDNILKSLKDGIVPYPIGIMPEQTVIESIIKDFFQIYGDVALPDGAKAKIAFYFKTQKHLQTSKTYIENTLLDLGESTTLILENTQQSSKQDIDEFNRLNDKKCQKRIILLIGKGTEGWNCPSLFCCALIKEQTMSNNFVLQASTRCLRQVEGNSHRARIFLDTNNMDILNKELEANFGTSLRELRGQDAETEEVVLRIRKTELPKLEITRWIHRVVRAQNATTDIQLRVPTDVEETPKFFRTILTPDFTQRGTLLPLSGIGEQDEVEVMNRTTDCYLLAQKLATRYQIPVIETFKKLKRIYPEGEVPNTHIYFLHKQVEEQTQNYTEIKEKVTEALALIRTVDAEGNDVFEEDEDGCYVHRLRMLKRTLDRMRTDRLLFDNEDMEDSRDVSFHYMPYNFDVKPEREFFELILNYLNVSVDDVQLFLFTGALTDIKKTDFYFKYKGKDGHYHNYFPDFVIVKNTGEFYIVEIKSADESEDPIVDAKRKAVEHLKDLQPDKHFDYNIIYTPIQNNPDLNAVTEWIRNDNASQTNSDENTLQEENSGN